MPLSAKQLNFCQEYVASSNATQAYKAAGYKAKSDAAAATCAGRLLKKVEIQAYIDELRNTKIKPKLVSLERTLEEIGAIAFARPTDIIEYDSKRGLVVKNFEGIDEQALAALQDVSMDESFSEQGGEQRRVKVRWHSKTAALKMLADFYGFGNDFNQARVTLKRYGIAMVPDGDSDLGWRLEKHDGVG